MDSYDEMNLLQRRSKELRSVSSQIEDIKDWIAKNTGKMQSGVLECVEKLDAAMDIVDEVKSMIEEKAAAIEEQVYSEG